MIPFFRWSHIFRSGYRPGLNPQKFKYINISINSSSIEILLTINLEKALKLNSLFFDKVVLLRFKEFHALQDDEKPLEEKKIESEKVLCSIE